jgi:hypothetical protein
MVFNRMLIANVAGSALSTSSLQLRSSPDKENGFKEEKRGKVDTQPTAITFVRFNPIF